MSRTVKERKTEYSAAVQMRGEQTFLKWKERGASHAEICAEAELLEKGGLRGYRGRMRALVLACAIELHVKDKYGSFLKRLFHPIAYSEERRALSRLKELMGYPVDSEVREAISVEMLALAEVLAKRAEDEDSTDGGMRAQLTDPNIEVELEAFFEEERAADEEREGKGGGISTEREEKQAEVGAENAQTAAEAPASPEQTPVEGVEMAEKPHFSDKPINGQEQVKAPEKGQIRAETEVRQRQEQKPIGVAAAGVPAYADVAMTEEQRAEELPSPFPVFRPTDIREERVAEYVEEAKPVEMVTAVAATKQGERVADSPKSVGDVEFEVRVKNVFPVFREGDREATDVPPQEQKPAAEEDTRERNEVFRERMYVSEENQFRRELNDRMSEEQILAIAQQKIEQSKLIIEEATEAWNRSAAAKEPPHGAEAAAKEGQPPALQVQKIKP